MENWKSKIIYMKNWGKNITFSTHYHDKLYTHLQLHASFNKFNLCIYLNPFLIIIFCK